MNKQIKKALDWFDRFGVHAPIVFGGEQEVVKSLQELDQQISIVRGAIIGSLASGHINGAEGAEYSKNALYQIASILDIELPETIRRKS